MTVHVDHSIVPCRNKAASAKRLGELLGVPWEAQASIGPFAPVFINDGFTLDFIETDEDFPIYHFCFRAVLLFQGDSPTAAEAFVAADPYVKNGLVRRWTVRPWTTVVGKEAASPVRPSAS